MIAKFLALIGVLASICGGVGVCRAQSTRVPEKNRATNTAPSAATAEELDGDLREMRWTELEQRVQAMPAGTDRDYFEGMLANREGQEEKSAKLLSEAIPKLGAKERQRAARGTATLADDYAKLYRYKDATEEYTILKKYAADMDPAEMDEIKDDTGVLAVMSDYPPQKIERGAAERVKTQRSAIGTIDATLKVNGVEGDWILDTGANLSCVTKSFAKRLGLKVSEGAGQTKGGTNGLENPVHLALLPELDFAGAKIRNVVVMVFDDANLNINLGEGKTYQIEGIIGYPVFRALGASTFAKDGYFEAREARQGAGFSRIFMNRLNVLVQGEVERKKLLFSFDTGASDSEFTKKYFDAFPGQFKDLKSKDMDTGGAGGTTHYVAYELPTARMEIGGEDVELSKVMVLTSLVGTGLDELYGNLGQDLIGQFGSFTVDFGRMRFSLEK